ncbi:class I SAM-dependent methyltransferase [Paenibacillus brevis]|uniref:Class I SAM-dependent methyltransferase n=1 Tax=Paenibacillus brevis TaxID=2841508 RepID=A0ABS6FUQ5_9BACL|nr:class I SAM-dependent methyltransferase [Paenibacillus brevis]MBU5673844.1 class I SAM-dependent methyltransferase [Paenibacillus brevis]
MPKQSMTPGMIMNQIRSTVRKHGGDESIPSEVEQEKNLDQLSDGNSSYFELMKRINEDIRALSGKVPPNMPIAFQEPRLVSRFRLLGKIIVPIRKFGARLFTKWYVDPISSQQHYLNKEMWSGLNRSIEIITNLTQLETKLINQVYGLNNVITELKDEITRLNNDIRDLRREDEEIMTDIQLLTKKYSHSAFEYSAFSKRFSAPGDAVKQIFTQYLKYIKPEHTVLDIGCGQGYFLELLNESSIKGIGVDSDPRLVSLCIEKGLTAYVEDGHSYLQKQSDESIDSIFLAHVIEHLTLSEKIEFLDLSYKKLKKEGVLILETPNTTSVYVMHNLYYLDPTHEKPLFPEALKHLAEVSGFTVVASYLSGAIIETGKENDYYNYSLVLKK